MKNLVTKIYGNYKISNWGEKGLHTYENKKKIKNNNTKTHIKHV